MDERTVIHLNLLQTENHIIYQRIDPGAGRDDLSADGFEFTSLLDSVRGFFHSDSVTGVDDSLGRLR